MVMPNMTNEYKMKETELAYRKHMFKEMSFPKGNVLVWLAVLSETLYRDAGELSLKVVVDVGIPVLSNRTHRADSNLISQIRSDMADYYQDALVGKNESVGIAIEHESFTATYVTLGQIIDICQSVFGCSMTAKGEYLHVRLFPPILTVVEYPLGTDRLNMALDVICGNNKNPLRGMVYESPQQNIVCVVAPVKSLKDFEDILKNNTETDIDDDQE
ncbi:MAG: hypothetical protein A2269_00775 [Lentisphaerae bacterium RIFOXYA12_FULL_60_10]|nr:MAG: hypothetical protein A2269_00775 [Lentisphaerae bacterium RIFOXYA12_FULL_60_10]